MLTVRGLVVNTGGRAAVSGLALRVENLETIAIVGANGSGKSTVGRAIAGLQRIEGGEVEISMAGVITSVAGLPASQLYRMGIEYVPASRPVFEALSVSENLAVASAMVPAHRSVQIRCLEETLGAFPIVRKKLRQLAASLSGGEKRMVALARAHLAAGLRAAGATPSVASILILDEPTHGLAPVAVAAVALAIEDLRQRLGGIIVIEQNIAFASQVARRGYVMSGGSITWTGELQQLDRAGVPTDSDGVEACPLPS